MSTDVMQYASGTLDERWQYAQALCSAGDLLPKALRNNAAKVFYAFEVGSMLGLHPVAALQGVNVIEGKPTLSPELMSGVVRRAGHKLRVTVEGQLADLSLQATAVLIRHDDPDFEFTATWTISKAQQAGLLTVVDGAIRARSERGLPLPWEKYTAAMLKARAIGEVCREGAADALMGVSYIPEELGGLVNEAGELIQVEERREPPKAEDYRPIALSNDPALQPNGQQPVVVVDQPAAAASEPETDMEIVGIYGLERLSNVEEIRTAYKLALQNGHMDRPVEGKPLGQWLEDLAAAFNEAQEAMDAQAAQAQAEAAQA